MDRNQIGKRLFVWYSILWVLLLVALYLAYGVYFVDTMSTKSKWVGVFAGAIGLLLASCKAMEISFYKSKIPIHIKITKYFTNGSFVFVKRLFKISLVFVFLISCCLIKALGLKFVGCFVSGSFFAFFAILFSVVVISKIATRSSQFYNESNLLALKQIYNSGVVVSFLSMGLSIVPLVILFHITKDYQIINGFVLGAALVAIINNVSTAISRQAVSCADNVARSYVAEYDVNDRRNPLLLLSGITKSILGTNILASDAFVSFSLALVVAMSIGGTFFQLMGAFLPIIIAASGIFACVIVVLLTRFKNINNPLRIMFVSVFCANIILVIISYFLVQNWLPGLIKLVISVGVGAFGGYFVSFSNFNFICSKFKAVSNVSNSAISGFSTIFRQAIKESFRGVVSPVAILVATILLSFVLADGIEEPSIGIYGVSLSILSMLSCVGLTIGICSFGLTTKTVDTILDTYEEDICEKQNNLNNLFGEAGFYAVSLCKNFINSATILVSLGSIIAYSVLANLEQIDIMNPYVLSSLLIGAVIPFLYSASIMGIVSKTTRRLVFEVKSQIKKFPQILRYEIRPDYEKCVDVAAINSSLQVIFHTAIIILIFALIVRFLNIEALAGFVFGIILSSVGLMYSMNASSVLGRNAKKYFEAQFSCVKNTEEYNAINLNEAILSSFKEIVNPSLNALIKFMAILALALIPMFI